jgi:hypothetical protein
MQPAPSPAHRAHSKVTVRILLLVRLVPDPDREPTGSPPQCEPDGTKVTPYFVTIPPLPKIYLFIFAFLSRFISLSLLAPFRSKLPTSAAI